MTTAYTSLLGFALPVTGELNGTWGDVVNDSITQLVEDSVAGSSTASVASGDWTLTTTGSGAANQARTAILIPTGSPGVSRNIIAPSSSKAYVVINQSDAAVVLKGSATTGVSIAAGTKVLCAWNGSDFIQVGGSVSAVSVATANGFAGTSSGGSTPALTLTTSVTGVIKGNGTAISAATAGTDYVAPGGALGTPSSGTLTNCTGLPVSTGVSGLGSGVATWLATPSSSNLAAAVSDETGSGALVFGTTPTLTGPRFVVSALGTLTTGTTTIDLATANSYSATITASNTITIAFSNAPSAGNSQVVLLRLTNAGSGTIVWPANTKFAGGTAPTLTASGVDVLGVYYDVTTTTYMVFVIGLDVKVP